MRTALKLAFRPSLESCEPRIVATSGVTAAAVHHPAHVEAHHATKVAPAVHHAAHAPRHPAHPSNPPAVTTPVIPPVQESRPALPGNTSSNQAWVELVNMTGQDIQYQIKLAPYAGGQFLTFDIGPGQVQDRWSSLIANGRRVNADFAIQFGNGPVTPLSTGPSQQSARGYYLFMDSNFEYYVSPFVRS